MTTLAAGDVAIVGFDGDTPDKFAFILLKDIDAGTVIKFTDAGWTGSAYRTGEYALQWTAPTNMSVGQIINYSSDTSDPAFAQTSEGGYFEGSGFSLSSGGDQIFIYQGTASANPATYTNIGGIHYDGTTFDSGSTSGSTSAAPSGLTPGTNVMAFGQGPTTDYRSGAWTVSTQPDVAALRAAIYNTNNWIGIDTVPTIAMPTGSVTLGTPEPEISIVANGVEIATGETKVSSDDNTAFGATDVASGTVTKTFEIRNLGGADLNLTGSPAISISGAAAADFTVSVQPSTTVAASSNTTFQVTFDPSAAGVRAATITVANTDADEASYSFDISGSGEAAAGGTALAAGDVAIVGYNGGTPDEFAFVLLKDVVAGTVIKFTDAGWTGSAYRTQEYALQWTAPEDMSAGQIVNYNFDADDVDRDFQQTSDGGYFTSVSGFSLSSSGDQIFIYQGTASTNPATYTNIGGIHYDGTTFDADSTNGSTSAVPDGLTPGTNVMAFGLGPTTHVRSAAWTVTTQPDIASLRAAIYNTSNWSGADAAPYKVMPTGTVTIGTPEPEIRIEGAGVEIASGDTSIAKIDTTDFGHVDVDGGLESVNYTIFNSGAAALNIGTITVTGTDAADFGVSQLVSPTIASGSFATFTVTFNPSAGGSRAATITVPSDDADEATYTFDIHGNGRAPSGGTQLSAGDVAVTGFRTASTDEFTFVVLKDIVAGTSIKFTDAGWNGTTFSTASNEGMIEWVAPTDLSAGTVTLIQEDGIDGEKHVARNTDGYFAGNFSMPSSGDQILIYQGTADGSGTNITNIGAANYDKSVFDTTFSNSVGVSLLPTGLSEGTSAVALGLGPTVDADSGVYTGPTTGTLASFQAALHDRANWSLSTVDQVLDTTAFTFGTPPSATLPGTLTVVEDTATGLDLSGIVLTDPDETSTMTVTLTASEGTFGGGTAPGVTAALNPGADQITLTGTLSNLNAAFAGPAFVQYTGALNDTGTPGATITVSLDDQDGSPVVSAGSFDVNITPVNDGPAITGGVTDISVASDEQTGLDLSGVTIAEPDGDTLTVTLTASAGVFNSVADGASGGVTETRVSDTVVTLQGTAADLNTYLSNAANLQYTFSGTSGDNKATLAVTVTDGVLQDDQTLNIDVAAPVFDFDSVVSNPAAMSLSQTKNGVLLTATSATSGGIPTTPFRDVAFYADNYALVAGGGFTDYSSLTLSFDSQIVPTSVLATDVLVGTYDWTITSDSGQFVVPSVVAGTVIDLSAIGPTTFLTFAPRNPSSGILAIDNLVFEKVFNDPPVLGAAVADDTAVEDVATAIDLSNYDISDANGNTITLTLAVDRGAIASVDGNGLNDGVLVAASGSASMTLSGSAADLNAYLNDTSHITYTTALNDTATATLTVTPNDGIEDGPSDTLNITIDAVNDAPTATGTPVPLLVTEDTLSSLDLSGVSFADVDSARITVQLSVDVGAFSSPVGGTVVSPSLVTNLVDARTITLEGTPADINTYLDGTSRIQYTPPANASGAAVAQLQIAMDDGDGSGLIVQSTNAIAATAVNDKPTVSGLNPVTVFEDTLTDLNLSSITVADVDTGTIELRLIAVNGTFGPPIAVPGLAVTVPVASSTDITLRGSPADLTAYLDTVGVMKFQPGADIAGINTAGIDVRADDGTGEVTLGTIQVNVTGINDAPTARVVPTNVAAVEDMAGNFDLSATVLEDIDSPSVTLTISVSAGSFVTVADGTASGVTATLVNPTTVTLAGGPGNINTYLDGVANLQYTPAQDVFGPAAATFSLSVDDGNGSGDVVVATNVPINIQPVNDKPTVSGLNPVTVFEDTLTDLNLSSITVADVDTGTIELRLIAVNGTFGPPISVPGLAVTVPVASSTDITLRGSPADLTAYLDTVGVMKFQPGADIAGINTAGIDVRADDGTGEVTLGTIQVNVIGINDAPTIRSPLGQVTVTEDTLSDFYLGGVIFQDVDSASLTVTVTITDGAFATPADGSSVGAGVTATLVNPTTVTVAGDVSDINTYLATPSNLQYTPPLNAAGNSTVSYSVTADDGDGSGSVAFGIGLPVDIMPVNDPAVLSGVDNAPIVGTRAVVIDPDMTVSDIELDARNAGAGDYLGSSLSVSRQGGTNADDVFDFAPNGTFVVDAVSGVLRTVGGDYLGSFKSGPGALSMSFGSLAAPVTTALVNDVLQSLTYLNTSGTSGPVALTVRFWDGVEGTEQTLTVQVDADAPAAPGIPDLQATSDTGASDSDNVTSQTLPTIDVMAEPYSTVTLTSDVDGVIGTAVATGGTAAIDTSALTEGPHQITATATDAAGNTSVASAALSLTIDTVAPAVPVITGLSEDTGSSSSDGITSDGSLLVSGTSEAGAVVTLSAGGTTLGKTTADASGNWQLDMRDTDLAEGTYEVTATATDAAGNTSAASPVSTVVVDKTAPMVGTPDLRAGSDTGASDSDDITQVNTPTFTVAAETGSTVTLTSDVAGVIDTVVATGGMATITASALADGVHTITATATDVAGNVSAASAPLLVTVDTAAPSVPVIAGIRADTGASDSDGVTSDGTLIVFGTAEAGSSVSLTVNAQLVTSAIADANGDWQIDVTDTDLAEGTYQISVSSTDVAGNTSASSQPRTVVVDKTGPTLSALDLVAASDTGGRDDDDATADNTPTIAFTAETGAVLEVDFGDGNGFAAAGAGTGTLQELTLGTAYATEGQKAIQLRATDLAGNQTTRALTITNNQAPTGLTLSSSRIAENSAAGAVVGVFGTVDSTPGENHALSLTNSAGGLFGLQGGSLVVAAGADLDFETSPSHVVEVQSTDAIGSVISRSFTIAVEDVAEGPTGAVQIEPGTATFADTGKDEVFFGRASSFDGKTFEGFDAGDTLQFDKAISRDQFQFSGSDPVRVTIDPDGDGPLPATATFTLGGERPAGELMVVEVDGQTLVTFETYLPTLTEGSAVDDSLINGVNNQPFLRGDGIKTFTATIQGNSAASFDNAIGVYEVTATGQIVDVRILSVNVKDSVDDDLDITGVEDGHELGFFLIQDGTDYLEGLSSMDDFSFVNAGGAAADATAGVEIFLADDGDLVEGATVLHSYNSAFNPGGAAQVLSGVDVGGRAITFGFEDAIGLDNDYQDVIVTIALG